MKRLPALLFTTLVLLDGSRAAEVPGNKYDFPIYTNKPSGKQLSGQHAPAGTPAFPALESEKKFVVPPGFEVRLFAAEPEVVNPVAMTWDERGRLWVLELYEYPLGAKTGEKPRDRIKILEDTDGDGRADKVTVFADGLNLATGLLLGNGGAYVGQAPDFLFLEDTDGDGKADKRTVLKTGFGLNDRHELLNGFTWGPDGWLYMTHGVFTHSKVKDPNNPDDSGVTVNAAVARFHPRTKKFEVFADGTSNPWGVDFDRDGTAFVSACVIDHLFHMTPGGIYVRQGGTPGNPYAYELLPSIVDHKHYMAAFSGICIYQGDQFPSEWKGHVFMGNIHQSAINHDKLTPNGSSFKATAEKDFLTTTDEWFRPVSEQIGPDGALWIADWYDKYPCYQNANADPEGVDREYGRIWRVVYVGNEKGKKIPSRPDVAMDLAKLKNEELVKLLEHPNVWQRRMAQRVLSEHVNRAAAMPDQYGFIVHGSVPALEPLISQAKTLEGRLAAFWTLHDIGSGGKQDPVRNRWESFPDLIEDQLNSPDAALRAWAVAFTAENLAQMRRQEKVGGRVDKKPAQEFIARNLSAFEKLASDPDASVRLAVATAARRLVSSSLTIDTDVSTEWSAALEKILGALIKSSADARDPLIPFITWMAAEPLVANDPKPMLGWLLANGAETMPFSGKIVRKTMRRICDLQNPEQLNSAVEFLAQVAEKSAPLAVAALDGLIEAQRGRAVAPTVPTDALFSRLNSSSSPDLKERAQRLGSLWGNNRAIQKTLETINRSDAAVDERIRALQSARQLKNDEARDAVLKLISQKNPETLLVEAVRALGEIGGGDDVANQLIGRWKDFTPALKRAAADTLVSRGSWAKLFLDAVEAKTVQPNEIPTTAIRSLSQSANPNIQGRSRRLVGRFRESDADKLKLIAARKKVVLGGTPDLAAGREIARRTCFLCHKLYGEGADIGPDLTGVGRSTLDALLANVIDPNQVIGKGYENVMVETKDGRTVSGRLVEDTATRVKLLSAGPREDVIARSDIQTMQVTEMSVMPEGLEQMPDEDFRNLIWYILNPPQDQRPMTPALRRQLIGDAAVLDGESAAVQSIKPNK